MHVVLSLTAHLTLDTVHAVRGHFEIKPLYFVCLLKATPEVLTIVGLLLSVKYILRKISLSCSAPKGPLRRLQCYWTNGHRLCPNLPEKIP